MSDAAKAFFDGWVAQTFAASEPWTDMYPTPLAAWTELRAAARLADLGDDELRAAVGDPLSAVTAAMLEAPAPDGALFSTSQGRGMPRTAAAAMELALGYAEGLQEAVAGDSGLAAALVLHYLARQGFALRPLATRLPDAAPRRAAADLWDAVRGPRTSQ